MGSYTIYDTDGHPHKVTATNDMQVNKLPKILLNSNRPHPAELSDQETEEILIGHDKMQAIIACLVEEVVEQAKELTNVELESEEEDYVEEEWSEVVEGTAMTGKASQQ